MVMLSVFKTGITGKIAQIPNLRQAERYLPDNIYTALDDFRNAAWTTELLGADVKARYADLKQGAEVQFHHDVYNQLLWGQF
jgi:glutamine synthetase